MITPDTTNNQDDFLNSDQNDRQQDINNSDSAKFTEDAEEEALLETRNNDQTVNNSYVAVKTDQPPLSTQGDAAELEANLGGSTNLSLDQLKKAHHPEE